MENILYAWYTYKSEHLTNAQFMTMAKVILMIIKEKGRGNRSFNASTAWVNGFKKRYNIDNGSNRVANNRVNNTASASDINLAQIDEILNVKNEEVGTFLLFYLTV